MLSLIWSTSGAFKAVLDLNHGRIKVHFAANFLIILSQYSLVLFKMLTAFEFIIFLKIMPMVSN